MGILEVKNLSYSYPRSPAPALRGLSFDVAEGEIFGFLGPSGAGKSTTQRILIRLRRGYAGTVTVLGRDLMRWTGDCGPGPAAPASRLLLTARFASSTVRRRSTGVTADERCGSRREANRPCTSFPLGVEARGDQPAAATGWGT